MAKKLSPSYEANEIGKILAERKGIDKKERQDICDYNIAGYLSMYRGRSERSGLASNVKDTVSFWETADEDEDIKCTLFYIGTPLNSLYVYRERTIHPKCPCASELALDDFFSFKELGMKFYMGEATARNIDMIEKICERMEPFWEELKKEISKDGNEERVALELENGATVYVGNKNKKQKEETE
jgi:hypothetical protein